VLQLLTPVESGGEKPKADDVETKERAPLVLTVPSDVMVNADSYIVEKRRYALGHILKRFTKSPFNYPWIADENLDRGSGLDISEAEDYH